MIYTLTRLYKANGIAVLEKAVQVGWISEDEKTMILSL